MIANTDGGVSRGLGTVATAWAPPPARPPANRWTRPCGLTRDWLLANQHPDGYWVGELEGDTILESEYVLLMAFLGREHETVASRPASYISRAAAARRRLGDLPRRAGRPQRLGQGVLRPEAGRRRRPTTRRWPGPARRSWPAAAPSGATASPGSTSPCSARSPTTTARACPPELVLLPAWLGFNLYAMSAWTRTIVVPLSIISALQAGPPAAARARASPSCSATDLPRPRRGAPEPLAELDQLLPRRRSAAQVGRPLAPPAAWRRPGVRPRTAGCSSTSRTPTASARSSRR